jgi:hypothetical protein
MVTWVGNVKMAFRQVWNMLQYCVEKGEVFNPSKFTFTEKEVEIFCFWLTQQGIKPITEFCDSI